MFSKNFVAWTMKSDVILMFLNGTFAIFGDFKHEKHETPYKLFNL